MLLSLLAASTLPGCTFISEAELKGRLEDEPAPDSPDARDSASPDTDPDTDSGGGSGTDSDSGPHDDGGCITIDGRGGYTSLADALAAAPAGSTIALCAGTWHESVTLAESVRLVGDGAGRTILAPGSDATVLALEADAIELSGLTVQGGVTVEGVGSTVEDVVFEESAGASVVSNGALGLTIRDCVFTAPAYGGVDVVGGSATVSSSRFTTPGSFAVRAASGAVLTLTENVSTGAYVTELPYTDGAALLVSGATVTLVGNQWIDSEQANVLVEDGVIDAADELWTGSWYGYQQEGGTATFERVTVNDAEKVGIWYEGEGFTLVDGTVSTALGEACDQAYEVWDLGCTGMVVQSDATVSLTGVSVSGYNNAGIEIFPLDGESVPVALDTVTVDGTGRRGVYVGNGDGTVNNLVVTNLREPELEVPCSPSADGSYSLAYSAGFWIDGGRLEVTNSEFASNDGWGLAVYDATVDVRDSIFADNTCSSLIDFAGAVTASRLAFSGAAPMGALWNYQGNVSIADSSFTNNHATSVYEYDDDGVWVTLETDLAGSDYRAWSGTDVLAGCTFTDGDTAVSCVEATVTVSDSTLSEYGYHSLYGSACDYTVTDVELEGVTNLLYSYEGTARITGATVGTTGTITTILSYYDDGVLRAGFPDSYVNDVAVVTADSGADIEIDGLWVDSAWSSLIEVADSSLVVTDTVADSVAAGGTGDVLSATWSLDAANLEVDGLSVVSALDGGIALADASSRVSSTASIAHTWLGSVGDHGLTASGFATLTLSELDLDSVGGWGVFVEDATTVTLGVVDAGTGTETGIYLYDVGTADIQGCVGAGHSDGLRLDGVGSAMVYDSAFTGNLAFGMVCDGTTLDRCENNVLDGNGSGAHSGCSDTCDDAP